MSKLKADEEAGTKGYEKIGEVHRILRCRVSDADRRAQDDALHALIEAEKALRGQKLRLAGAMKKLAERMKALDEEQLALHDRRDLSEVERTVRCEVRRTESELYLVRLDTGAEHSRRPLTAEEHAQIHPVLPHSGPRPKPHAVELLPDEETVRRTKADEEHAAKVAELLTGFDVQAALDGEDEAANDGEDSDDEPEEKPAKKGRKGKGKKGAETADMFPAGGSK